MKNQDAFGLADITLGENNEWNELHYVTRDTFAHMAPSVLRLEIGRLGRLIDSLRIEDAWRNALVAARYRLTTLREIVTGNFADADLGVCEEHLNAAILSVGFRPGADDHPLDTTLDNIADRLGYVRERLHRLR
ncbi:MAG: hypothetical protein ACI80V_000336 [Rhodothermales bacterium]